MAGAETETERGSQKEKTGERVKESERQTDRQTESDSLLTLYVILQVKRKIQETHRISGTWQSSAKTYTKLKRGHLPQLWTPSAYLQDEDGAQTSPHSTASDVKNGHTE